MKKNWTALLLAAVLVFGSMVPVAAEDAALFRVETEAQECTENAAAQAKEQAGLIENAAAETELQTERTENAAAETEAQEELTEGAVVETEAQEGLTESTAAQTEEEWILEPVTVLAGEEQPAATAQEELALDAANFPDAAFRDYLAKNFDTDGDKALSTQEIAAVDTIDIVNGGLKNLTGLNHFTALTGLYCDGNQLTALDVSKNTKLKRLYCSDNRLGALDVRANTALTELYCGNNQLAALDVSKNTRLQVLRCAGNQLTTLDLKNNKTLQALDCSGNRLTSLDLAAHPELVYLWCGQNQLSGLFVGGDKKLQWVDCSGNRLTSLDVSDALNVNAASDGALNLLNCADNRLTSLELGSKQYMKGLDCSNNALTELDVSHLPDLRQLVCANNALRSLDVTRNSELLQLDCSGNQLTALNLCYLSANILVLPDCSGQNLTMEPVKTGNGCQIDLKPFIGSANLLRITKEELLKDSCQEKSVLGNMILLTQEGELKDGILTFTDGTVPEKIELVCATGYRKKTGEKDVLLEITLCHTHLWESATKEPTCTKEGYVRKSCAQCGAMIETVLPATGHTYGAYAISAAATIFEAGEEVRVCSVCGARETKTLEKLKGTVALSVAGLPLQVDQTVSLVSFVTGLQEDDNVESWTSDNTKVATVNKKGKVRAQGVGKATITVTTRSGAAAGMTVTVQAAKVKTTAITGLKNISLTVGRTYTLKPALTPVTSQEKVTYSSSKKKVATVSAKGVIKGVKAGTAKIIVKSGSREVKITVKVKSPAVEAIKNIPASKNLKKGKKYTLAPKLFPAGSSAEVTFTSSKKKVATVNARGVITAKKKGTAVITVKAGKVTVKCRVTVK